MMVSETTDDSETVYNYVRLVLGTHLFNMKNLP